MHKSLNRFTTAGAVLAMAMAPALAAQDQAPAQTMPDHSGHMPESTPPTAPTTTPPSMPDTTPEAESGTGMDNGMDTMPDETTTTAPVTPTGPSMAEQNAAMQAWPADRQTSYKAWPADTQNYFWSLSEDRQNIFWALSDSDKVTLSQMPEAQRESTWAQIESRVNPLKS